MMTENAWFGKVGKLPDLVVVCAHSWCTYTK